MSYMRIRTHLLLLVAAVLVPVIVASGLALDTIREGERQAVLRGLKETVRATSLIVDRELKGSIAAATALGNSKNLRDGDLRAFHAEASAFNQLPDVWTVLYDAQGAQLVNTVGLYGVPASPLKSPEAAEAIALGQPVASNVRTGSVTGRLLTTISVPAVAGGGKAFVVAQVFSVEHWKNKALQEGLPSDWVVAVLDRKGNFISRSLNSQQRVGKPAAPDLVAAAAAAPHGLVIHRTLEGVLSYDAFTHSEFTGWTIAVAMPVKAVEAAANKAVWLAFAGMLTAVVLAALAVAVFGRSLMRAIEGACQSALALGRGQQPLPHPTGIHEIDKLHEALAGAAALLAIESRSRQDSETARQRLLENETLARESAEADNSAKDQFLAMLGHELRNPLAAIAGATALLERSGSGRLGGDRCVEIISRQNNHLRRIVDDLLDVSRLMAGKIDLVRQPLNIADAARNCVDALRTTDLALNKQITVEAVPVWVNGDPVRIDQILNNLLANALKFCTSGDEVCLKVTEVHGVALVAVRDSGRGISAELLPRVFDAFVQGPAPLNQTQSGLGIGLALVRQLVRLHGGDVEASSGGMGQGATFSFSMPTVEAPPASRPAPPSVPAGMRKIVYVEDNTDARVMTADLLRLCGYEVEEVVDGLGALPVVLAMQPDVVLLDIGLPDISGYEVARLLRANPATAQVPLIALTGYGQHRDKQEAADVGFVAHLVKPVDPEQLLRAIDNAIELAQPQPDLKPAPA